MSTQEAYEEYYVPHNSKLPIFASLGIFLTLFGMGSMFNETKAGSDSIFGEMIFTKGNADFNANEAAIAVFPAPCGPLRRMERSAVLDDVCS